MIVYTTTFIITRGKSFYVKRKHTNRVGKEKTTQAKSQLNYLESTGIHTDKYHTKVGK